jgi:predicted transcriptional regulator of viral defense system
VAKNNRFHLPLDQPFDYQLAMHRLENFEAARNKLAGLCASGEVIRVKKGLYIAGGAGAGRVDPLVLSGLVYGPSYVSRESALAIYGMIPERVAEVTCMTSKRARVFATPVGRFSYKPIHARVFSTGVRLVEADGGSYFLASPEKALCDRIAMLRGLEAQRDVAAVLEDELRIDLDRLAELDLAAVSEISQRYRRVPVRVFARWLERNVARRGASV